MLVKFDKDAIGIGDNRISAANDPDVISMPIGQIVGRMNEVRPVADVIASLVAEYDEAVARLESFRK